MGGGRRTNERSKDWSSSSNSFSLFYPFFALGCLFSFCSHCLTPALYYNSTGLALSFPPLPSASSSIYCAFSPPFPCFFNLQRTEIAGERGGKENKKVGALRNKNPFPDRHRLLLPSLPPFSPPPPSFERAIYWTEGGGGELSGFRKEGNSHYFLDSSREGEISPKRQTMALIQRGEFQAIVGTSSHGHFSLDRQGRLETTVVGKGGRGRSGGRCRQRTPFP